MCTLLVRLISCSTLLALSQIVYPETEAEAAAKGCDDAHLSALLEKVQLSDLLSRPGAFEARLNWHEALSGGEKQRLAFARLLYHQPRYAILDECTSAVSMDVEGPLYQLALDANITLISVSHRPSLWRFHQWLLRFDGEGGYKFSTIADETKALEQTRVSLADEKVALEAKLTAMGANARRLRDVCRQLGESQSEVRRGCGWRLAVELYSGMLQCPRIRSMCQAVDQTCVFSFD